MGTIAFTNGGGSSPSIPAGLINFKFDAFEVTDKTVDGFTEIKYYIGGLAGTLVATITITYDVDGDIQTVVRT